PSNPLNPRIIYHIREIISLAKTRNNHPAYRPPRLSLYGEQYPNKYKEKIPEREIIIDQKQISSDYATIFIYGTNHIKYNNLSVKTREFLGYLNNQLKLKKSGKEVELAFPQD